LILKKQHNFRKAFDNYRVETVAAYGEKEILRLMNDAGIIRNRLKINAAVENAKTIIRIRNEHGSFRNWLDLNSKQISTLENWTKLFRKTFKFTGGEIVNEFLMSTGYLPGSHSPDCPVYGRIEEMRRNRLK
jgi:DNA-3-methyladenine glycosylase I